MTLNLNVIDRFQLELEVERTGRQLIIKRKINHKYNTNKKQAQIINVIQTKTGRGWAHVNPKLTWNIGDQIKSTFPNSKWRNYPYRRTKIQPVKRKKKNRI